MVVPAKLRDGGLFCVLLMGYRDSNSEPQDQQFRGRSCSAQNHILSQYRFHISVSVLKAVLRNAAHIAGILFGSREPSFENGQLLLLRGDGLPLRFLCADVIIEEHPKAAKLIFFLGQHFHQRLGDGQGILLQVGGR